MFEEYKNQRVLGDIKIEIHGDEVVANPPFSNWIKTEKSRDRFRKLVEELKDEVISQSFAKATYVIRQNGNTNLNKYSPPTPLLLSDYLSIGVVTIGEIRGNSNGKSGALEKMVLDGLENVILTQAKVRTVNGIKKIAESRGLKTTRAIPPGSGRVKWGIENQEFIFENLNPEKIGVYLTESHALRPQKSVSFIMGLGKNIQQADNLFSCEGCEMLDCPYRK